MQNYYIFKICKIFFFLSKSFYFSKLIIEGTVNSVSMGPGNLKNLHHQAASISVLQIISLIDATSFSNLRGVIDKFVSFFHRIIIYVWIYIIFCHYQLQSVLYRKKTLKCKVRQTCYVSMMLKTSHVGDVVVKTLEDRCGWCTLSCYKYYSISAVILKF